MAVSEDSKTYWTALAESYSLAGSPLLPSREDTRIVEEAVAGWQAAHATNSIKALLLGVTPAIADMKWPDGSWLLGIDGSAAMVGSVWPGNVAGRRSVVCGDWKAVPALDSSFNVVAGDGSFSCMNHPQDLGAVVSEIRRILTDNGILIVRSYLQPAQREDPDDVFNEAVRGMIPTFPAFKFRLFMSMQPTAEEGIAVDEVYRYWNGRSIDVAGLAARTGWPEAQIRSMELYRGKNTVYVFPTLPQLRAALAPFFDEISVRTPSYLLGERCPTIIAGGARCSR